MRQFAIFLAMAGCAYGQTGEIFRKAPPHIEEKLFKNVRRFFQAHVDAKWRLAEEVIAPDSRDYFYQFEKRQYKGFEIGGAFYEDDFTKATVQVILDVEWRTPRLGKMDVKAPMNTLWKQIDGEWYWYVVPKTEWETPFGKMNPGPDKDGSPVLQAFQRGGVTAAQVLQQVSLTQSELKLSSYEPASASTEIVNKMPGQVQLRLEAPAIRGFEAKLEKDQLGPGESAKITFTYDPETKNAKETVIAKVHVQPTGQALPIRIKFSIPPEVEKLLPKQ